MKQYRFQTLWLLFFVTSVACAPSFLAQGRATPTATPTKTPTSLSTATPEAAAMATAVIPPPTATSSPPTATFTPVPTATPTSLPTEIPTDEAEVASEETLEEIATEETAPTVPPTEEVVPTVPPTPEAPPSEEVAEVPPAEETAPEPPPTEEATEEPPAEEVAYKIVHFKVLGEAENNGGIFNKGGMHHIFLTVLDENGNGLDGVVVKDANGSALEVVTGSKGPGKAEISMDYDPYRLYVEADPNGPTTSEVSHQMNTLYPHLPDVIGKLGSLDNEYSVCPTPDVRCTPPFYNVHFSYEITFQRQP